MGRKRGGVVDALNSFMSGYSVGQKMHAANQDRTVNDEIAAVDKDFTPRETPAASGEEAYSGAMQAKQIALSNAADDAQRQQIEADYQPTISALEANRVTPASVIRSMGIGDSFRQQADPFSENEVRSAKAGARADVYSRHGREDDAARVLSNETRRRALADDAELRAATTPQRNQNALMASAATDMSDLTANNTIPQSATGQVDRPQPMSPAAAAASKGIPATREPQSPREPLDHYLKEVAPKAVQTLVKQGRIEEAKRYADFMDSREGIEYARAYTKGLRQYAVGDHEGAMTHFEKLYNDDLYPDGRKIKMTALDDGQLRIDQVGTDGKVLNSKTGKVADLAEQAALALNPLQAVKFMAEQNAKRQGESATLNRQIQLEELRQKGRETSEDRRDERLGMRLDAQGRQLERRLEAGSGRGGLTAAQQRGNFEIDAAREMVAGLSDEDIRQRTAPTTATGRENPLFDPALSRAAKLAGRRKIGDDEAFDARTGKQPAAQPAGKPAGTPIERARASMAADPNMEGLTLGDQVMGKGFKVYKNGKHVGYYGAGR
jgi:hypothetical protein